MPLDPEGPPPSSGNPEQSCQFSHYCQHLLRFCTEFEFDCVSPLQYPITLELMELENIVANTVYLKAREGGPEGSKGRRWDTFIYY